MKLIKGKFIAGKILAGLKKNIATKKIQPQLAVILVGENKASKLYIRLKIQAAQKVGIKVLLYKFKTKTEEKEIIKLIKALNKNKKINGIIVQLPLPPQYRTQKIIKAINLQKDADGFSVRSGFNNNKNFSPQPVFPYAIMKLLESAGIDLKNKKGMVICNSDIFGKTMTQIMRQRGIITSYLLSQNLKEGIDKIKLSDVLVTAVGKPGIIKGEMIKKGAIIIDGGITKQGKKVLGDVDFHSAAKKASYLSPVPGGVGPVTIACLLENVYQLWQKQNEK